jgi:hypothetical protein
VIGVSERSRTEEFKINGDKLVKKVQEIIHEGNVRRIIIKDNDGKSIAEFPLTIGVVGAVFAPAVAAISVIAALVSECTLVVEREA